MFPSQEIVLQKASADSARLLSCGFDLSEPTLAQQCSERELQRLIYMTQERTCQSINEPRCDKRTENTPSAFSPAGALSEEDFLARTIFSRLAQIPYVSRSGALGLGALSISKFLERCNLRCSGCRKFVSQPGFLEQRNHGADKVSYTILEIDPGQ